MTKVKIVFKEYDEYRGYDTTEFGNVHSICVHPSGLLISIELADGTSYTYPMSNIRSMVKS